MGDQEILATALNGLTARLDSDAEERRSLADAVEQRFRTIHEDIRRDRREVMGRIDQWGQHLGRAMKAGFKDVDARLDEVCDVGKVEHQEFRSGIAALTGWQNAKTNQAKGRDQVLGPVLGFVKQHAVAICCIVLALYTGARDVLIPLAVATNSDVAAINAVRPFEAQAYQPPPEKPSQGPHAVIPITPVEGIRGR